ncbi:MAG: hypothetical protein VX589_06685 [Myxococcota bacterium]|nr:hypothetical protein [Myxococcota bacterium]
MNLTRILVIIGLCLSGVAYGAESLRAWQGGRTVVKAKHLIPAMKGGEGYGEKYTFDANFGDRGSMYFSLAITNLGFGDHKMEAKGRLTVDGQSFKWKKKMDRDEWSFDRDKFSINAGPAKVSGTPERLVFVAKSGDNEVELVMTPIARAWRPNNGQIQFGKSRSVTDYTVFPLMKAEVRYRMKGGEPQTVTGHGYGTRTWSELAVYDQVRWNLEFRAIEGDKTIYIRQLGPAAKYDGKRIGYVLVTDGGKILVESFDFTLTPTQLMTDDDHENRYKVPESFTVMGKDAEQSTTLFRGKFQKKTMISRKDLLASLNSAVRMLAKRYSKPVKYTYTTDYLFEIKTADSVERLAGDGRYEVYHWNK